jgi:hypothetical protein
VQKGYGDSNNGIHPKSRRSHELQAGEIPSVESPIMSHQAGQLWEKVWLLLDFFP